MIRADGSVRWCSARAVVVRDSAGAAIRLVGIDQDVTDKHAMFQRTLESETRLRFAMDAAGAGAWEYVVDTNEFIASDRALDLHGMAPGAAISHRAALDAVYIEDRPRIELALRETISTGAPFRQDIRVLQRDGTFRWLRSQAELRADGGQKRLVGLVQDITQSRNAEAAALRIRKSGSRSPSATRPSPFSSKILSCAIRGYTIPSWVFRPSEVIGKTDAELMDAEGAQSLCALKRSVLATGLPQRQEVVVAAPGGVKSHFDLYVEARRDSSGTIIGVICAATDITDLKAKEEHAQFLLRELSHRSKNTLAVVQAVVSLSSRSAANVQDFSHAITARLSALAASNDLLINASWQGVRLNELAQRQIGAFLQLPSPRVHITGPAMALSSDAAQTLGLAFHELSTNALKYGALSNATGQIDIVWRIDLSGSKPTLLLEWREQRRTSGRQPPQGRLRAGGYEADGRTRAVCGDGS